jgi:hypothetical protein
MDKGKSIFEWPEFEGNLNGHLNGHSNGNIVQQGIKGGS